MAKEQKVFKRREKPAPIKFSHSNVYHPKLPAKVDEERTDLYLGVRWEKLKVRVTLKDGTKKVLEMKHMITPLVCRETAIAKGLDNRKIFKYRRFKILRIVQLPWRD